jgi:hypothetical protein
MRDMGRLGEARQFYVRALHAARAAHGNESGEARKIETILTDLGASNQAEAKEASSKIINMVEDGNFQIIMDPGLFNALYSSSWNLEM